jgi:hypothetical protein
LSKAKVAELLKTLATENDMIIATDKWPRMKLDNGLNVNSKGGHGPIRYTVQEHKPDELVRFRFTKPSGFNGTHMFEILEVDTNKTELKHTINMNVSGRALVLWTFAIRWLHDAFMEDAFDKVENYLTNSAKVSEWGLWIKFLRKSLKPKSK